MPYTNHRLDKNPGAAENGTRDAGGRRGRVRRSPAVVRQLLLDAARDTFAASGYAGASTREIAERAAVSEALLFRHFGTKAQLFQRAVFDPFNEFVNDYLEAWQASLDDTVPPAEVPSRNYVAGLYDLLREHRKLVMALVAAQAYEDGVSGNDGQQIMLSGALDRLQDLVESELERRGFEGVDIPVTIRLTFGMVLSMAVLEDWLFAPGRQRPNRDRVVDEMVSFMVHGLAHRAGATEVSIPEPDQDLAGLN